MWLALCQNKVNNPPYTNSRRKDQWPCQDLVGYSARNPSSLNTDLNLNSPASVSS